DGGVARVAEQPLVGRLAGGAALHAHTGLVTGARAEEGEDLLADLRDHVAVPRLVLPGARLGQAVAEQLVPRHAAMLRAGPAFPPAPCPAGSLGPGMMGCSTNPI